jgi:hypothetical protein
MKEFIFSCLLAICWESIQAQHLYLEAWGGLNRTAYGLERYGTAADYRNWGARFAIGADHFQIGAEYFSNLTNPSFSMSSDEDIFEDKFYGGFIRANISRYPAMRFGLVLRAGAGVYFADYVYRNLLSSAPEPRYTYESHPGLNAGAGFSIPVLRFVMLQLSYNYSLAKRPTLPAANLPSFNAGTHSFQAGLSFNFVFGKRAEKYKEIRPSRKNIGQ